MDECSDLATRDSTRGPSRPGHSQAGESSKLNVELDEEKLLEVEAAVQDNLKEIALATDDLENAKRALVPSAQP